jgi:peptidoglycan lytic transglycosylase F
MHANPALAPLRPLVLPALWLLLLSGCAQPKPALEQLRERGELRVVTLNQPTTYYLGAHGAQGFEYRLAQAFAAQLHLQLVIVQVPDMNALRNTLVSGMADIAAAQITPGEEWRHLAMPTTDYQQVPQLIVQRRGRPRPSSVAALAGARLVVATGSPQMQLLRRMRGSTAPFLSWTELPPSQADPLDWVSTGDADYAIVDSNEYEFAHHLYPDVTVAFMLPDPRPVRWLVRRDALDLRDAANSFLAEARRSGLVAKLVRESQEPAHGFQYEEAHRYQVDVTNRLPQLRPWFEEAASSTGLDWRLLAAVGYQESKWDSDATSDDGAAGIMMLTADTADSVDVKDRTDPRQNIRGGAEYLAQVVQMIPERIAEPDRTWLALAAYNVGYGHVEDARILTQIQGRNPDRWDDVRQALPLLAEEQWYSQARRGYARGWEPVRFVDEVRGFLAVLEYSAGDSAAASAAAGGKKSLH